MYKFNDFISRLINKMEVIDLPGIDSQLKMAPITRKEELAKAVDPRINKSNIHTDTVSSQPRKSAVLILFFPINNQPHVVFIKRAVDNTVHSGQISFPGGKYEKYDKTIVQTALRESNEEVGIDIEKIDIIGKLTQLYIPPSNFNVTPFIGYTKTVPQFTTNYEVDRLITISLSELLNPNINSLNKIQHRNGNEFVVPAYNIDNEVVWGATAMILSELIDVISEI